MLARHTVESCGKWRTAYDESGDMRKGHGSKGARIFRNLNEPDEIFVLSEWKEPAELRYATVKDEALSIVKKNFPNDNEENLIDYLEEILEE